MVWWGQSDSCIDWSNEVPLATHFVAARVFPCIPLKRHRELVRPEVAQRLRSVAPVFLLCNS